jgi:uncharacterized membrane protein HdeD (DUF308 family)
MQKTVQTYPWAVALLGLLLVVAGTIEADSKSLSGNPVQLVFDIAAIAGWVLLIGGIVMFVKSRKAK